jgi:hypothetical protein
MDLSQVVLSGALAERFQVVRSKGAFVAGGFSSQQSAFFAYGVVSVASGKDLDQVPEGDRIQEARVFHSRVPIYLTRDNLAEGTGVSDILVWKNTKYRVISSSNYSNRNYYRAVGVRMEGK